MRKILHRADYTDPNGKVSALCFKRLHAIDLTKALWTTFDEAVTCPRCKRRMAWNLPWERPIVQGGKR